MSVNEPWEGYCAPFRMFGNLYFVGTQPASTHIVDTGDGLMLFDSGYQHSLYIVLYNMQRLGLDPANIKYIILTHGHIDHMGATKALVNLTGAKTFIGEEDRGYVNGEQDLSYAKELGMNFTQTFEPDVLLHDGDIIRLGNTEVLCRATPGHTPGAMSFFFNVYDGKEHYRCGLHGGMGINTMCRAFLDKYGLSYDCRDNFCAAMDRLAEEKADIFLGNHMQHNHTMEKQQKIAAGDRLACVVPGEWSDYCRWAKQNLLNMIKEESAHK